MKLKKILIIDDEHWSIESIIDRINSTYGHGKVDYCQDGLSALEQLRTEEYACIILDIMFALGGDLDDLEGGKSTIAGLILLGHIRDDLKCDLPVICFTIRDDDDVKALIEKHNNACHISKVDTEAMQKVMSEIGKYLQ